MINIIIYFYSIDIILNFWKPAFGSYPPLKKKNNNNIEKKPKTNRNLPTHSETFT